VKELLLKRKFRAILYIVACIIPVIDRLAFNLGLSLLLGSIEVGSIEYFVKVLLITLGIITFSAILYIISRFMRISYMRDTLLDVRIKAFDKIINSSYKSFHLKSKDSYISNLINDINIFETNFFLRLINLIYNSGVFISSLIIITFYDYTFAAGIFIASIILFIIIKRFENRTISLQEDVSKANEEFLLDMSNTFNGLEILKLNSIEDKFLEKTFLKIKWLERKKSIYSIFVETQDRLSFLLGYLIMIGILIYQLNVLSQGSSFTSVLFMFQLSNGCVWSIVRVMPLFNDLKASVNIYNKITTPTEAVVEGDIEGQEFLFNNIIEIRDLYFSYDGKKIFDGINFDIEKGKKYLIKGASGAGKSTLIKLLSKIYEDYDGQILVDGVDYRKIREDSINDNVSFIYQDVFLFEETIANNITLYKDYEQHKISVAVKYAGLKELLEKKENGINETLMENGKNLSGGERQRISIARAIIKDSSILFVDEGTSSLNEELGRSVENTILSLDSTVIAISHRYYKGITEKYDYVLEISNGRINKYPAKEYFNEVYAI
jgi:ABC-type multidrug transport system fused ATPase/permease subunit